MINCKFININKLKRKFKMLLRSNELKEVLSTSFVKRSQCRSRMSLSRNHAVQVGYFSLHSLSSFLLIYYSYVIIAGSLEAAYSLNWGAQEIWGKGGGETLALL